MGALIKSMHFKQIAIIILAGFLVGWISNSVISNVGSYFENENIPKGYVITPRDNVESPAESDFDIIKNLKVFVPLKFHHE